MLLDINHLHKIKFSVNKLFEEEIKQIVYSLIYFGYKVPYDMSYIKVLASNISGNNYMYLDESSSYNLSYGWSSLYFEQFPNFKIDNPKDLIINDLIVSPFRKVPNGMFINDNTQCREIKLNKTEAMSYPLKKICKLHKSLLHSSVIYSRSLNHVMVNTFFKG